MYLLCDENKSNLLVSHQNFKCVCRLDDVHLDPQYWGGWGWGIVGFRWIQTTKQIQGYLGYTETKLQKKKQTQKLQLYLLAINVKKN